MRKKSLNILLLVVALSLALLLVACSREIQSYNNLEADGTLYFGGTQELNVTMSEYNTEYATKFLDTITKDDIILSDELAGKVVDSVKYVSSDKITITISGDITATTNENELIGKITISSKALENGANGNFMVRIAKPSIMTRGASTSTMMGKTTYSSIFALPYGSFANDVSIDDIKLVDTDNGEVSKVEVKDGTLHIEVTGYDNKKTENTSYYPSVVIDKSVTSFDKYIIADIGNALFLNGYFRDSVEIA